MKKIMISICLLVVFFTGSICISYLIAKEKAEKVAKSCPGNLSPLYGHPILWNNDKLSPFWLFSAEYSDFMTGATFDVSISPFGEIIHIPPLSKIPK